MEQNRPTESDSSKLRADRSKLRALEPIAFIVLALIYIWVIQPIKNDWLRVPFVIATALIPFASNLVHKDRLRDMGVRFDNFWASAREVGLLTLTISAGIIIVSFCVTGSVNLPPEAWKKFIFYPFWGLAQQYAMQSFVFLRFRECLRNQTLAAIVTAGAFAIVHWPNQVLTLMTLFGGFIWCKLFERRPNLFTLAISHGLLAVLLYYLCPDDWVRNLRIGPRFYK